MIGIGERGREEEGPSKPERSSAILIISRCA